MAAPGASSIILPADGGNTGDKLCTQIKTVGSDPVHEYFFRPALGITHTGRYWFAIPNYIVQPAASSPQDGINTGFFWFHNPATSTITGVLRRIVCETNSSAATVMATATVISFAKFTFVTDNFPTIFPSLPSRVGGATAQMRVSNGKPGVTLTLVSEIGQFQIPACETATAVCYGGKEVYPFNPLAFGRGTDIEFGPSEGFVIYQSTLGTATENRKMTYTVVWDEIDLS